MVKKHKSIFKKNALMMASIIIVLIISIFLIDQIQSRQANKNFNIGGNFILTNQNGEEYDSKQIKKKKLIYFGYTFCPDVCPFDVLKLSNFLDSNPNLKDDVEFIFITVDPERDKKEQIKSFLENFNPSIIGLTGSKSQVEKVIGDYRIFVRINGSKDDDNYLVDHSSLFFLIDQEDKYISHFRPDDFKKNVDKFF